MAKTFNSSAQNLVYHLEVGVGASVLKAFLFVLFMALMALLYTATQYQGFRHPRAMEQAQLARTFAETGQFQTRLIRPGSVFHLQQTGRFRAAPGVPPLAVLPDMENAPVYPLLLGTVFKLFDTRFPAATGPKFPPEQWVIIPINLLFCFVSALFVYLSGRKLFSPRVALTSVTLFLLSAPLWAGAVSGTEISFALLCSAFAGWCLSGLLCAETEGKLGGLRLWLPLLLAAFSLGLLLLTRYAAAVLLPGFVLSLFLGLGRRAWLPALALTAICLLCLAPWVLRNLRVSGRPFGLAPTYSLNSEAHDYYQRNFGPVENLDSSPARRLLVRSLTALKKGVTFDEVPLGSGLVLCFFAVSYFYPFQRRPLRALRWGVLLSYLLLIPAAGLFGEVQWEAALLLLPWVLLYGTAIFYVLVDRLQIEVRILSLALTALLVFLHATPLLVTMMPPKPTSYPPYRASDIHLVTSPFGVGELICTDMPWATAWYGGRPSLYLPTTVDQFFQIHDRVQPINAMYLTMLSRNRPYQADLIRGIYQSWKPILDLNPLPRGFPLVFSFPVRGGEAVVLADRNRWAGPAP